MPKMTVENEVSRGTLRLLEFSEGTFMRPLAIIYKRGRELSPAVRKFIEVLTHNNGAAKPGRPERAERERSSRGERVERATPDGNRDGAEKLEKLA